MSICTIIPPPVSVLGETLLCLDNLLPLIQFNEVQWLLSCNCFLISRLILKPSFGWKWAWVSVESLIIIILPSEPLVSVAAHNFCECMVVKIGSCYSRKQTFWYHHWPTFILDNQSSMNKSWSIRSYFNQYLSIINCKLSSTKFMYTDL